MSLTRRFSALFLGVLSLLLLGFSTVVYVSARIHLDRQSRDRLGAALAVLAAAAEIHPKGVEWEPGERDLPLGQETGPDRLQWMVLDDHGRRIDHSRNWTEVDVSAKAAIQPETATRTDRLVDRQKMTWLVSRRRVLPGVPPGLGSRAAEHQVAPAEASPNEVLHPFLVLVVCAPLNSSEATLANLAAFLVAVSVGSWLLAALFCRRLSRQALAPLTRMVESARGLDALDPGWYLQEPGTGDELDELGRAFNDLLARLEIAYHRQREFSNDASHQLRTPLTILTGQIEVALRQERSAEEYRRVLRAALARGVQLRQIVEALLFLGRADADAALPDVEPLDLNRWIAEHLSERLSTPVVNEIVYVPAPGDPLRVRVHPGLLAQLIDNLLDNACKYGEPGSRVQVESRREGDLAILTVADTGQGITDEDLPRVFEPFFRAKRVRNQGIPGVGLGLAIVERIAVSFGGTVAVQSKTGSGSRFEVQLPLASLPLHPSVVIEGNDSDHGVRAETS